jgi:two-component system sensor histidine kinase YesM
MAKIQKNTGIADITRSLISLLRNIAVNPDDLITLEDELGLLEDYTLVMSLRFMGIFNLENRIDPSLRQYLIPKLTLQPLVENAIIHGIAPSGAFGTIVLEGRFADSSLIITVEDSGCGIEPEQLRQILRVDAGKSGTSFNTVGVKNVDERLRLIYGEEAGLEFESVPGKFTRVTVRLTARTRAEGGDHAPCSSGG